MAFCSKGLHAAKDILHKLTPSLEKIIDTALSFTGKLMLLTEIPIIGNLIKMIPGEAAIQAAILKGLDILTSTREVIDEPDLEKKLALFLADLKKYDPKHEHAILIKLASLITAILHSEAHSESTYDSLVQLKAVVIKHDNED